MRTAVCAGCFLICQPNRVTTNGYAPRPRCCARSSRIWLCAPLGALMTCGSWTPPPRVRPQPGDRQTVRPRRVGHLRLLRSHSPFFWGLRLHLITTPRGSQSPTRLTGAKADERGTALDMIAPDPNCTPRPDPHGRQGLPARQLRDRTHQRRHHLLRPTHGTEKPRARQRFLRPFRQIIESVNQTLKAQLDLERHGGRTKPGVCRTRPTTTPRPHRHHLAQRDHPTTRPSPQHSPPTTTDPLELLI